LVEDDPATLKALRGIFDRRGWEVWNATTIADALAYVEQRPNCVVLDLMLPDGDGTVILAKIRAENLPIRVAVTTGSNDSIRLNKVLNLKPDVLLTKPVDLRQLLEGMGLPY
jgi:two-component system KDP operon response regulator KdpE